MPDLNRRQFVTAAVAATAACAGVCALQGGAFAAPATTGPATLDAGKPADFAKGSLSDKFNKSDGVIIAHEEDRIFAISNRCTHKGARCLVKSNDEIRCPAHGSVFSEQGTAQSGPAKASLFRFGIKLDSDGHLIVDKSKTFGEKQWDDAAAFVKVV